MPVRGGILCKYRCDMYRVVQPFLQCLNLISFVVYYLCERVAANGAITKHLSENSHLAPESRTDDSESAIVAQYTGKIFETRFLTTRASDAAVDQVMTRGSQDRQDQSMTQFAWRYDYNCCCENADLANVSLILRPLMLCGLYENSLVRHQHWSM
jgi:hypothetical protein